jgi:DNA mismatch repair protein MutS2
MLFNLETLKPAYKLEIGLPGSSYAFEIASMAGLPDFIIKRGQELAGKSQSALEELLADLREKQEALRISLENARILEIKAKEKDTLQKSAHDEVQKAKRKILEDARIFASKMIADANVKIEATIKEIRDSNADKQVARQAKKNLEKTVESFEVETGIETPELEPEILQYNDIEGERPITGDWVRIIGTETIGKVILENARDFTLALGGLRTNIKKSEVVKVKEQIEKVVSKGLVMDLSKASVFSPTIDIRGSRVDEALPLLNKFVDDARLSGAKNLRIIHGKGTGALRMAIQSWASGHLLIESAQEAHIDQGGAGATDLILKTN